LVTVQTAVSRSRALARWAVVGTTIGTMVWGLAGFFGVSLLLAAAPWLLLGLRLAGGVYLVWLGLRLVCGRRREAQSPVQSSRSPGGRGAAWRCGFLTSLSGGRSGHAFYSELDCMQPNPGFPVIGGAQPMHLLCVDNPNQEAG